MPPRCASHTHAYSTQLVDAQHVLVSHSVRETEPQQRGSLVLLWMLLKYKADVNATTTVRKVTVPECVQLNGWDQAVLT